MYRATKEEVAIVVVVVAPAEKEGENGQRERNENKNSKKKKIKTKAKTIGLQCRLLSFGAAKPQNLAEMKLFTRHGVMNSEEF